MTIDVRARMPLLPSELVLFARCQPIFHPTTTTTTRSQHDGSACATSVAMRARARELDRPVDQIARSLAQAHHADTQTRMPTHSLRLRN